jgi:hypothetical protein
MARQPSPTSRSCNGNNKTPPCRTPASTTKYLCKAVEAALGHLGCVDRVDLFLRGSHVIDAAEVMHGPVATFIGTRQQRQSRGDIVARWPRAAAADSGCLRGKATPSGMSIARSAQLTIVAITVRRGYNVKHGGAARTGAKTKLTAPVLPPPEVRSTTGAGPLTEAPPPTCGERRGVSVNDLATAAGTAQRSMHLGADD